MLQVDRPRQQWQQAQQANADYGYVMHWPGSGESACCSWEDLPGALLDAGAAAAGSSSSNGSSSNGSSSSGSSSNGGSRPLLSGPLWLGPLHERSHLQEVQAEAAQRGWLQPGGSGLGSAAGAGNGAAGGREAAGVAAGTAPVVPATRKGSIGSLKLLLDLMLGEVPQMPEVPVAVVAAAAEASTAGAAGAAEQQWQRQQRLPPWFLRISDVGRVGALVGPPSRDKLAAELRRR